MPAFDVRDFDSGLEKSPAHLIKLAFAIDMKRKVVKAGAISDVVGGRGSEFAARPIPVENDVAAADVDKKVVAVGIVEDQLERAFHPGMIGEELDAAVDIIAAVNAGIVESLNQRIKQRRETKS